MRLAPLAIALALLLALPPASAEDVRHVASVSRLLDFDGCTVAPGEACDFVVHVRNPYWANITAANLSLEFHAYATVEGSRPVDASWPSLYPALETPGVRAIDLPLGDLRGSRAVPGGEERNASVRILTSWDMPHGSALSQASYGLRVRLEFDHSDNVTTTRYRFASWHHFTQEQRLAATAYGPGNPCPKPWCYGDVNISYLGVDGILPDTAIAVHEPFPEWPYYLLSGGTGFFLLLAVFFYAEENPKLLPRTARFWAALRGRLAQILPRPVVPKVTLPHGGESPPRQR
jgi:hypothetical protein